MVEENEEEYQNGDTEGLIKQPWQFVKVRYDFNLLEKNIYTKIIEKCQFHMKGLNQGDSFKIEHTLFGTYPVICFAINEIEGARHYERVRQALGRIQETSFGVPLEDGWDYDKVTLLQEVKAAKKTGKVKIILTPVFWRILQNVHVYKLLDPQVAYKFKSVYAERIYELLVGNTKAITFRIDNLKTMFMLENKYKNNSDFIRNVIVPAQREMMEMEVCPFYFEYNTEKEGRKIAKIQFFVVQKDEKEKVNHKLEALRDETKDVVKLSDRVVDTVKLCFPQLTFREDVELKLKKAQLAFGVDDLCTTILNIKMKYEKVKESDKLQSTMSAYFIGTLAKMVEEREAAEREKHISKIDRAERKVTDCDSWEDENYKYLSQSKVRFYAEGEEISVEEWTKKYEFEYAPEHSAWRVKK